MEQIIGRTDTINWMSKYLGYKGFYQMSTRTFGLIQGGLAIKLNNIECSLPENDHRIRFITHDEQLIEEVTVVLSDINQPQGMRFNEGKLEWALIDFKQLEGMVRVLEFGAKKYDRDNWKKGLPMRKQCESMMRHLVAIMNGELKDEETGLYHWDHIKCNAMFMSHTYQNHPHLVDITPIQHVVPASNDDGTSDGQFLDPNQHENLK